MKGKIVEQFYKKVDNIDEKVKDASMPYMQWKVLFLVGENTNAEEISSLLKEDLSSVEEILASLESKSLVEKVEESKADVEVESIPEEEAGTSIGDELLMEEEEVISQVDEQLDTSTPEPEEEQVEPVEPTAAAQEQPSEPETIIPDFEDSGDSGSAEIPSESEMKPNQDTFSLEEAVNSEEVPEPELTPPLEEVTSDQRAEAESADVLEEEFDLSIDEPETATLEEQPAVTEVEDQSDKKIEDVESPDEEIISDGTKKTVMVIDDSIVIRKMIEIALEEEDYNIITAISGKEGLETIEKEKPNLVILDMMLPDMNGIEVLKTIKTEKKIPVIMLSGKDSPQLIETAKEVGVDDFLPKPFRDEELVEKVKTLIEV